MTYLEEVVKFIEKNTAGVTLGGGETQYSDPYTGTDRFTDLLWGVPNDPHICEGGSRYQPASGSVPGSITGGDPFTGASRYQPSPAPAGLTQSGYSDPFTGTNRYQPSPSPGFTPEPSSPAPPTPSPSGVIPHVGFNTRSRGKPVQTLWTLEKANHLQSMQHFGNAS